jgi:hypothetical protein
MFTQFGRHTVRRHGKKPKGDVPTQSGHVPVPTEANVITESAWWWLRLLAMPGRIVVPAMCAPILGLAMPTEDAHAAHRVALMAVV